MSVALGAVVRTTLSRGAAVYVIAEAYRGTVDGGDRIRIMTWDKVQGVGCEPICVCFEVSVGRIAPVYRDLRGAAQRQTGHRGTYPSHVLR